MRVVEKLTEAPEGWIRDDSKQVDKNSAMITLRIHLKQQDMDKFHDMAMKVSHPLLPQKPVLILTDCHTRSRTIWKSSLSARD